MDSSQARSMNRLSTWLFVLASSVAMSGCAQPQQPEASPALQQAQAKVTEPLRLTEIRVHPEKDSQRSFYVLAKVEETGAGRIVGLSWRLESYQLPDGTTREVSAAWRPGDTDELAYGKTSLDVRTFGWFRGMQSLPHCKSVKLRLRAAVAESVEMITIPNFQLGKEYQASGHGYSITASGKKGVALGRHPAIYVGARIWYPGDREGLNKPDFWAKWRLDPQDHQKASQADVWVNWRMGFLDTDGKLTTPAGQGGGFYFLGHDVVGKTFAVEVPVNIRLMDTVVEIEMPKHQSGPATIK